ncbi:MAG: S8 family serine peptidase, partial [Acidobacteriota bacterium]
MKRRITYSMIFLIFLSTCLLSPSRHQAQTSVSRPGDIIVNIREGASIDDINSRHGTTTRQQILGTNFYELYAPAGRSIKKTLRRLRRDRDIASASMNHLIATVFARSIMTFPDSRPEADHSESDYRLQPQLVEKLRLDQSHRRSRGAGVVVAVIDTGVALDHPALQGHLYEDPYEIPDNGADDDEDGFIDEARGWDFYDNDNDPTDERGGSENSVAGHGTFIAGLIALMAPDCRILPIRAFDQDGNGSEFLVASAINYAVYQGAQVISLSCGTTEDAPVLRDAIIHAREQGVILVAAFGNEGTDAEPQYPANQEEVIG